LLDSVRRALAESAPSALTDYLDSLSQINRERRQQLSMLEVVERLQLLDWNLGSRRRQGFVDRCKRTLSLNAGDFIKEWVIWRSPNDFIHNVLYERCNETNLRACPETS
jgi:hypothetical protein